MQVRPYAAADLDDLIALFRGSVRQVARRDYSLEQVLAWAPDEIDRDVWALRLAASSTWVGADGDRAVGFASLEPDGHLDMLYVHAELQGRGIATKLLARVEASARARGLARPFTEASITARPFLERRGFAVIQEQIVVRRGQELANFRMDRPV
ncbi:MAG TPA: GNAT family N-acetyltransferase [Stellaceae bacterium]|nr:GNAT family N-acetyltransferase [Stellaceae bacterium]